MCGIFGIVQKKNTLDLQPYLSELFRLSESRGKEASGLALACDSSIEVLKTPFPASELIKSQQYKETLNNNVIVTSSKVIGHSRLVTNGDEYNNLNNQPVNRNNMVVVHNGIITNHTEIWGTIQNDQPQTELDSELIPVLLNQQLEIGKGVDEAVAHLYDTIYGMTSIAVLFENKEELVLATNNGSLYFLENKDHSLFIFASERHILNKFCEKFSELNLDKNTITQLNPLQVLILKNNSKKIIDLSSLITSPIYLTVQTPKEIKTIDVKIDKKLTKNTSLNARLSSVSKKFTDEVNKRELKIATLKRCTKCILPETFPFIAFDTKGVCNYCNNYKPLVFKGEDAFKELTNKYRATQKGKADCLVPFSGGRDSSFALHYIKKELGLKPIAFSYDWGMLTDLSRRNQARMCGALGVEHILISADIRTKRKNIQKNVTAWLKRPHLGTIPLFMAGDKQYFYYANLLMQQNDLKLSIMGENMLETTRFKTGFCGVAPDFSGDHTYSLATKDKLKMMFFYSKEYVLNPAYINSSLLDTLDAFKSYYIMKHQNVNIFDYLKWDENQVDNLLINTYNWETDPETKTTWRIGDGTAAFYNYIYYMVAGFTENDTFRSNQIREGMMTREEALVKVNEENQPRWASLQWYCSTIGLDWEKVVERINEINNE
jgi:glutamine---fructose-6-phosphate transaminase (isomerizing)